jgi:hypothetical protein
MLSHLHFKAGSSVTQPSLKLSLSPVTIFVGPNNGGKSRALAEIEAWVTQSPPPSGVLLESVQFEPWNKSTLMEEIEKIKLEPSLNQTVHKNHVFLSTRNMSSALNPQIDIVELAKEAQDPNSVSRPYFCQFLKLFTVRLDGKNRLALTEQQPSGDMQLPPQNHLAYLFKNDSARFEIRRAVYEAFGKYFVIDPTNTGTFRIRLALRPPIDVSEERGWDQRSCEFHSGAALISTASDGVKAFVGILTTLVASDPKVTLLDEPEAFLHPALSTRLGKEIANIAATSNRRLFVATHSASFLMGCIQSGAQMNIVRLTYDNAVATARLLSKEKLTPLMRNPLLRSAGVLNALFYSVVVVTEADADRAFYQEINERLLFAKDPRGIEGCLFLNAQNKQTVWDIIKPLRELGIPAVGVVDIDVIKEGGTVWKKPMESCFFPTLNHDSLGILRSKLNQAFSATEKDMKRNGGVTLLNSDDKAACSSLFSQLAEYGVFVVENGEIESWLPTLNVSRNKATWLTTIFEKLGEDPSANNYIKPTDGDVWDFLGSINAWASNSNRKGIPV